MRIDNFKCGNISKKITSSYEADAISAKQEFFYLNKVAKRGVISVRSNHNLIAAFLPSQSDIKVDNNKDVFISKDGIVCDAYDFSSLTDEQITIKIEEILTDKQLMYPENVYVIEKGEFPIRAKGSYIKNDEVIEGIDVKMSTHVLYLRDYKKKYQK